MNLKLLSPGGLCHKGLMGVQVDLTIASREALMSLFSAWRNWGLILHGMQEPSRLSSTPSGYGNGRRWDQG